MWGEWRWRANTVIFPIDDDDDYGWTAVNCISAAAAAGDDNDYR